MRSPTVTRNGKTIKVKNLGWLLRNWREVESFRVSAPALSLSYSRVISGMPPDAILTANLRGGGEYVTEYVSAHVLASFLHRPVFDTLPVDWYGVPEIVGASLADKYGAGAGIFREPDRLRKASL